MSQQRLSFARRVRGSSDWQESLRRWWRRLPKGAQVVLALAGIAFFYLLPVLEPPLLSTPDSDFGGVLFIVATYTIVCLGLNVVVGEAGLLDLGYVGFFAVGAYSTAVFGSAHAEFPWLATVPIAIVLAVLAGLILGTPTLRLRGDYLAIVTLGFGEIIRITARNLEWLGAARGIDGIPRPPSVGPIEFKILDLKPYYWLALTLIILVIFLVRRLQRSRVGRAWTAIREDEDAAELMGVPTFRFKLLAFAIGAAVGGLAGTMFAAKQGFVNPESFQLLLSILFLAAIVLGGLGSIPGVLLGAFLVFYLPERFRGFAEWRFFVFGVVLVVMMIFRPQGLIPARRRAGEIADAAAAGMHDDRLSLAGADLEASLGSVEVRGDD